MQNRKNSRQTKTGFTLIELMLAVAFLGTLLLSIAMLAMRLVDMYTKGATMRSVNSVGSAIMDDMRAHISSSTPWMGGLGDGLTKDNAAKDKRQYYRYHTYTVDSGTAEAESYVDYGAFCTNSYTYVFNNQPAMLRYREGGAADGYLSVGKSFNKRPYGLVRIKDPDCTQFKRIDMTADELSEYNASLVWDPNSFWQDGGDQFLEANADDMTVLLDGSQSDENSDLQLYDFSIMSAVQSNVTKQTLYDIAFVLGTTRGGINVKSSNNYCKKKTKALSGEAYADEYDNNTVSYCSVNRFEFVVRQTGGKE